MAANLLAAFTSPTGRSHAARSLAARIGCERLVLFGRDPDTSALVAVAASDGERIDEEWVGAIQAAADASSEPCAVLVGSGDGTTAVAIRRGTDGSVMAAIGGAPKRSRLCWAQRLLPAIVAMILGHESRIEARAQSAAATHLAAEVARLATTCDRLSDEVAAARGTAADAQRSASAAEARALEARRLKDDFLSTLSHELRTPLNAVLGWVQMLRLYGEDESVRARAVEVLERNARAQAQLVSELLDVSRIIRGQLRIRRQPVDLPRIITDVCESLRPCFDARGQELVTQLAEVSGVVNGDPDRLQQMVWNLVSNAAKFTPPGGRIAISLSAANQEAAITVTDTGIGIHPEFVPHLFERFRQWDSTTTRAHGGLGLGLAVVRHVAELHGGFVEASSQGEDRGATFTVHLPLAAARPAVTDG